MYCSKCGKEIADNSQFCNFCGASQNQMQSINVQEKNRNNKSVMDSDITSQKGCLGFLALIVIGIVFSLYTNFGINSSKPTQQQVSTQQTTTNNQEEIKKIENYINEFQKAGIFVKVTRGNDEVVGKTMTVVVDEYAWNNLDYETKKGVDNMFHQYWKIADVTTIFVGYRTGQKLFSKDKNFKI